ncbi:PREDICTED: apolipoprotein L2-like [Chinchilla lanigera]|uniref:apolipoprotein L2-like n=1 Tax=Chinchilla lanigera TaxID=34839 RepID=UPI000698A306|nr:PREDICTED: apolipoprotein L2-like [Chinchilla lanigera]
MGLAWRGGGAGVQGRAQPSTGLQSDVQIIVQEGPGSKVHDMGQTVTTNKEESQKSDSCLSCGQDQELPEVICVSEGRVPQPRDLLVTPMDEKHCEMQYVGQAAESSGQLQQYRSKEGKTSDTSGHRGVYEDRAMGTDTDSFIETIAEHILHTLSIEDLQQLLTEDATWEILMEKTDLTREEADAMHEALIEKILQARKRFLNAFPHVKKELQEGIAKLYALAEKVDKVHKDCTITNVVASSSGAVSGIFTILGFLLAPVTAGGSLLLSATGMGLGAAAAVTGVTASIVDEGNKWSAQAEASHVLSTSMDAQKDILKVLFKVGPKVAATAIKCKKAIQGTDKIIHAIKEARSNPQLLANAKRLMRTGKISVKSVEQVQKSLGGTVLAMTKRARIRGGAMTGVFLLWDVYNIVQDSVHLQEGKETESAAELRKRAQDLERKLEELIQIHERLQVDLTK